MESHPFGGKRFHCSVCRAPGWGPFFSADSKTLFAIYVTAKSRTDAAKQALSGRQGKG